VFQISPKDFLVLTDFLPKTTRVMFRIGLVAIACSVMVSGPFASFALADVKTEVEAKLVETQKKAAPDLVVGKATCPAALAKPAKSLTVGPHRCSVLVEGVGVPYDVTVRLGGASKSGSYAFQNAKAVIDTKKLSTIAASVVDDPTKAKISCGKSRVVVADLGAIISCTVVDGKSTTTLKFAVKDLRGTVGFVA
jgi:hypothetical protein